ncbi:hypothetical protein KAX35_03985 [candidate division WOR-3 bacterium]|nr:hypothetical protein [candidate division WOR-3 bacterium]
MIQETKTLILYRMERAHEALDEALILTLLHQKFVKPGVVDAEMGRLYDKLFDTRQKGDYADLVYFNLDEIRPWFEETKNFVDSLEKLIKKKLATIT